MKVLFVTQGGRETASSRIRAWDVASAWRGATCTCYRDTVDLRADWIIWQKVYPGNFARAARDGARFAWDLSDPAWWWMPREDFLAVAQQFARIVVPTTAMRDDLQAEMGVTAHVIPDRLPATRSCKGHGPARPVRLVWFGYAKNRAACLSSAGLTLARLAADGVPFELVIVDDHPEAPYWQDGVPWRTERWALDTFADSLLACDVALLPPFPGRWGRLKSGNKELQAAWLGLPTVDGEDYGEVWRLLTNDALRALVGSEARRHAETYGDVRQSVADWQRLLRED